MRKVLFTTVILVLFVSFLFFILLYSVDNTPYSIYGKKKSFAIKAFVPEGWGFFTRDPQEEKLIIFKILPDCSLKEIEFSVDSKENLFGFSRKLRKRNFEYTKVLQYIPADAWADFFGKRENIKANCKRKPLVINLKKDDYFLLKDSKLLLYRYRIVPWEWSNLTKEEKGKIVYVSISME
nr:SdpA family antimicrobial peptide system protein [uncultured Allomuricauda sp.]